MLDFAAGTENRRPGAIMRKHLLVCLLFVTAAFNAEQARAEDAYVRKVPLDAFSVPTVPIVPPGSSLDLRPGRAPDAGEQINNYSSPSRDSTTPSIGLSIKSPFDDRK